MGSVVQHSTVDVTPLDPGLVLAQNFVLGSIEGSGSATSLVATYPQPVNLASMLGVSFSVDRDTRVFLSGELFLTAPGGTPEGVGTVALSDARPCSGGFCPSPLFYLTFANPAPTSGNPGPGFVQPFSYEGTLAPGTYQLLIDALVSPPNDSGASDSQTAGWSVSFAVPEPGSAGLLLIALLPLVLRGVRAAARRS